MLCQSRDNDKDKDIGENEMHERQTFEYCCWGTLCQSRDCGNRSQWNQYSAPAIIEQLLLFFSYCNPLLTKLFFSCEEFESMESALRICDYCCYHYP